MCECCGRDDIGIEGTIDFCGDCYEYYFPEEKEDGTESE